ncbi:hypothetical protein Ga0123462_2161 [Mariprofundus ferrinatatus]|uniref:Protochlamydia outer membrane protein domain-containing protein n=1 Tax=Mariprofundus ferrinatatus TaxID=1921087 RepID=A0A2K8LFF2_9PROT|nr:TorF family putative porin [Mariprofundus ferrinatatus]ATX82996.1 hypothetical protein Ga0123462_2161 [Mariprofundus ferrinatatus]
MARKSAIFSSSTLLLCFFLLCSDALADEASEFSVSSNIGITSDYTSRGLRMSWGEPAIQLGVDLLHQSGWYVSAWGSQVSDDYYANGTLELDLYLGHGGSLTDLIAYDFGVGAYFYPGANYSHAAPKGAYPDKRYDTVEAYLGFTYDWLTLKYSVCITDYFGYDERTAPVATWNSGIVGGVHAGNGTRGSSYLEANADFDLGSAFTLGLHAGLQLVTNSSNLSYSDYRVSLAREVTSGWSVSVAVTTTQGAEIYNNFLSVAGNGRVKNIGGTHWQAYLNKAF